MQVLGAVCDKVLGHACEDPVGTMLVDLNIYDLRFLPDTQFIKFVLVNCFLVEVDDQLKRAQVLDLLVQVSYAVVRYSI